MKLPRMIRDFEVFDNSDVLQYMRYLVIRKFTVSIITDDTNFLEFLVRKYNRKYMYRNGHNLIRLTESSCDFRWRTICNNFDNPYIMKADRFTFLKISRGNNSEKGNDRIETFTIAFSGNHAQEHMKQSLSQYARYRSHIASKLRSNKTVNIAYFTDVNIEGACYRPSTKPILLRTVDSVIFDQMGETINYIKKFISRFELYERYQVPYHTGVLLYGHPGTGKTSIISAICESILSNKNAHDFGLRFYSLNVAVDYDELKDSIEEFITSAKMESHPMIRVMVMEEIDGILTGCRNIRTMEDESKKKVDTILKLLDGSDTPPGTIFIATTNYIDSLDPALVRKGRFDLKYEVGYFNEDNAKKMCDNFDVDYDVLKDVSYPIIPVDLQSMILQRKFEDDEEGDNV